MIATFTVGPSRRYVEIARDLIERGARVDTIGVQMHIYSLNESKTHRCRSRSPHCCAHLRRVGLFEAGRTPIHISEVTITAPDETDTARKSKPLWQGIYTVFGLATRRLWESLGWNMVDGGAAEGEPSYSGLYDTNMVAKPCITSWIP